MNRWRRLIHRPGRADPTTMETTPHSVARSRGYQNAMLTLIAVMVGLGLLERQLSPDGLAGPAGASAQGPTDPDQGGLMNALEQRKVMIAELRSIGARLDKLDAKLAQGLSVKVVDMPPIKLPADPKAKPDAGK